MYVRRSKRWVQRHQVRFEGIVEAGAPGVDASVFRCPRRQVPRRLAECLRCPDFVNLRPDPALDRTLLRCLCTDDDLLVRCTPTRPSWPTVRPLTPVRVARRLARVRGVPALLVAEGDELRGVVYRDALEAEGATLASALEEYPWALSARATLGDAVEAMAALAVPVLLLVAPDGRLVSVISAAQLLGVGVPEEVLVEERRRAG
jgi:hypothetical protein